MKSSQYPWSEIKAKYETGNYSMRELAEEYGFNPSYARRKAAKKGWEKGKSSEEVTKRATEKILDSESDKEASLRAIYEEIIEKIRKKTMTNLKKEEGGFGELKKCKIASQIIKNCRKEQWEVNKIKETAKQIESTGEFSIDFTGMDEEDILKEAKELGIDVTEVQEVRKN